MVNAKRLGVIVGTGMLSLVIAAGVLVGKEAKHKSSEESCHGKGPGKCHMMCPMHIKGAKVKVKNTKKGVIIRITAKDAEIIKEIQKSAANMKKSKSCSRKHLGKAHEGKDKKEAVYICPMGEKCYKGSNTKDGLCPNCGMKLEKEKTKEGCKKCKHNKQDKQ